MAVGIKDSEPAPVTLAQGGRHQRKQWQWPHWCLNRTFPMIEVYITDEDTGESTWVEAEPIGRVLNKDGFDAYLSVEYGWDGEYYIEDFGPRMVRQRGQFESVYELLEENGFVDDETDSLVDNTDDYSCDDLSCGNCEPVQSPSSLIMKALQRSGHWVCEDGAVLLSHQESRCLEDDADDSLMQDIIASRSAEDISASRCAEETQAAASDASADSEHARLHQVKRIELPIDDILDFEQYVIEQTRNADIASRRDLNEQDAQEGVTSTPFSQRWPSLWWPSAKRTTCVSRSDWQLPIDSDRSQSKIVSLAAAPVRIALKQAEIIISGIDAFGWTENVLMPPMISGTLVSPSSVEAAMPVGDEAV